jgi:NADH-quinone oxidoreductase subunit A
LLRGLYNEETQITAENGARPARTRSATNRGPRVLAEYLPTLLFLIVATGIGVSLMVIGRFLGPRRPDAQKLSPYECGFEAFEDARMKFDVRYYLVAILFILFDLETAFFFPWGVSMRELGLPGFLTMMVFIVEFVVGFWYIWKKGALDWE